MQHGAKDKKRPRPVGLDGTIGGAVVKESFKRKKLELDSLTKLQGVEEEKSWKKKKMMMKKEKNKEKHRLGASNQSDESVPVREMDSEDSSFLKNASWTHGRKGTAGFADEGGPSQDESNSRSSETCDLSGTCCIMEGVLASRLSHNSIA